MAPFAMKIFNGSQSCPLTRWEIGDSEDQVNFRDFVRTLAHFRPIEDSDKSKDPLVPEPLNSRNNKLLFAFRLYDLDKISREVLLQVLRMMVGVNISEEQLGSIADRTIQEAD
ncbi:hypothetical protein scyTo_0006863 [Scyliorhinus torazame]|uniref:Uncharacterized protein n=1 Tax=Scyliorhinus torazame TaxID=75743 RepID=A0A401NHQ8_SCYTO|nr:hypothetical protein [Scyliorhinus torazame]